MKKLFLLLFLLPLFFTAQLRFNNIIDLYNIKSDKVGSYVIGGLGFKNIGYFRAESSENFEFYNGKNTLSETLYVRIMIPFIENARNIVTIRSANEEYIQELKSDVVNNGFEYIGKREHENNTNVHMYTKLNSIISISEFKNANGLYEINIIPRK